MEFKPYGKFMLGKRVEISESSGGIKLPQGLKTKMADIIEIGPEVTDKTLLGRRVVFFRSTAVPLEGEAKEYIVLTEQDILGTLEKEEVM